MKKQSMVDADDAPALTGKELHRPEGKWLIGGKVVSGEEGKAAFRKAWKRKIRTNIHFDSDVISHYKAQAGDRGYQTLINAALRRDMEGSNLKNELLQAMKDELFKTLKAELLEEIGKQAAPTSNTSRLLGATPNALSLSAAYAASSTATYALWTKLALGWDDQQEQAVTKGNSNAEIILGLSTPTQGTA